MNSNSFSGDLGHGSEELLVRHVSRTLNFGWAVDTSHVDFAVGFLFVLQEPSHSGLSRKNHLVPLSYIVSATMRAKRVDTTRTFISPG